MNREGFMNQLEGFLTDIPAAEKEEALQYYNDYFDDAGSENEQSVISSLGSPRMIADNIKAELKGEDIPTTAKAGDHAITKYGQIIPKGEAKDRTEERENRFSTNGYASENEGSAYRTYTASDTTGKSYELVRKNKLPRWAILLIVIGLVIACPAVFGILTGVFGTLIGLFCAWFGFLAAGWCATFGLLVAAIVLFAVSIITIAINPVAFMAVLGVSMLCGSFGLLGLIITGWLTRKATPALFKGVAFLCKKIWQGIGAVWKKLFA